MSNAEVPDEKNEHLNLKAGTYMYFAPELFFTGKDKKPFGPATDIWALGITIYYLLTGVHPYEDAQSLYDLVDKIQQREVNLDLIRNDYARAVVKRMLDKNPDTRVTIEALIQMDWVTNNGTEPLQIDVVEKTDGK